MIFKDWKYIGIDTIPVEPRVNLPNHLRYQMRIQDCIQGHTETENVLMICADVPDAELRNILRRMCQYRYMTYCRKALYSAYLEADIKNLNFIGDWLNKMPDILLCSVVSDSPVTVPPNRRAKKKSIHKPKVNKVCDHP